MRSDDSMPITILRVVLSGAAAILVPLFLRSYLAATISVGAVLFLVAVVTGLGIAWRLRGETYPWLKYVAAAATVVAGGITLVGILITPLSAYVQWFESFRSGVPDGGVSNLFVLIGGFFSAVIGPMMLTMGVLWPVMVIGFVLLYLLTIIMQTSLHVTTLIVFLALAMLYYTYRIASGRARGSTLAFSVAIIVVSLVAASLFPSVDDPPGSEYVNKKLHPELRETVVESFPRFPLLYAVPGYGITFDEKKLGGKPTLLENPLFRIRNAEPGMVYVKTRVFDSYDGSSWSMSPYLSTQRFDAERGPLFSRSPEVPEGAVEITLTAKRFKFIPFTVDTARIYMPDEYPDIESGSVDTGYRLRTPLVRDQTIYLEREDSASAGEAEPLEETERALYLQIPEDLPTDLRYIAEGLSAGLETDYEILANIEAFLAENYSYNLEAEEMMQEAVTEGDFVYSFLFEATSGYCVQFATSYIILARLAGIPARYATGYLAYMPNDVEYGDVTGLSAHAWPEVWLEETGWVNWEATPAVNLSNYTQLGEGWVFNYDLDLNSSTSRQLEGLLGRRVAASAEEAAEIKTREPWGGWPFVGFSVLGIAVAVGVFMFIRHAVPAIRYAAHDQQGRFYHRVRSFSRRMKRHGLPDPAGVGWLQWTDELEKKAESSRTEVREVRNMILRSTYGNDLFDARYVDTIADLTKQIRKAAKQQSNHTHG